MVVTGCKGVTQDRGSNRDQEVNDGGGTGVRG